MQNFIKYQILETPDSKFALIGVAMSGHKQLIVLNDDEHFCRKLLKDIELGYRDELGHKLILEKNVQDWEKKIITSASNS